MHSDCEESDEIYYVEPEVDKKKIQNSAGWHEGLPYYPNEFENG